MQIDFHHAVTYVTARLAGFTVKQSETISYAAQYVDDAVNSGAITFRNRAMYSRISSAHRMLDYRNFEDLANHFVWVPFHFLPGNGGKKAEDDSHGSFIEKLVCRPDSPVAQDMVRCCIADRDRDHGLHRLGVTMHVLADTYAHQGFAGINHTINHVHDLEDLDGPRDNLAKRIYDYFGDTFDAVKSRFVGDVLPLGHGAALTSPDLPFLKWAYTDEKGERIKRDNTRIFMDAVEKIHEAMVRFRRNDPVYTLTGDEKIGQADWNKIQSNFTKFDHQEGENRHEQWLKSIARGDFSFSGPGEERPGYIPKGYGSWKHAALDTKKEIETKLEKYRFNDEFLTSDWKMFHDALQIHRMDVIRNILPEYGICVA